MKFITKLFVLAAALPSVQGRLRQDFLLGGNDRQPPATEGIPIPISDPPSATPAALTSDVPSSLPTIGP